jgi:hypothetical protein
MCLVCAADLAQEVGVGVLASPPAGRSDKSAHDQEHEEATLRYATEASTGGSLTPDQILARIGDGEIGPSLQAHMITQGRTVAALRRELGALKKQAQAVGQSDAAGGRLCRCPVRPYFSIGSLGSGSATETQAVARWEAEHGRHPYARARDELSQALQKAEGAVGSGAAVLDMVRDVFELQRGVGTPPRQTDSAHEARAAADLGKGPERP